MSGTKTPARTRQALDPLIGVRVRRLHGQIQAHWAAWFATLAPGLTPAQGGTLLLIQENPGITQGELAALLNIEAPSLSQILAPLVRRQLIARHPGAVDRRVAVFTLTPEGDALASTLLAQVPAHEAVLFADLSAEEQAQLKALLDRVIQQSEDEGTQKPAAALKAGA